MDNDRLTIRLDGDLKQKLEEKAGALRKDNSFVVREALRAYLAPSETAFDAFKKAGLIGIIKNGPADLSTNPKHMDGFGKAR